MRTILHVDLDAFFPSVEVREHPELKGRPVIVGADPKEGMGRGVVSSASYEARIFGVNSAMPISRAWKLCPHGVYLRPDHELYQRASNNVMRILRSHAGRFEQGGIDEAYLDLSGQVQDLGQAADLARGIMQEVLDRERLSCSVGVAPNKMLAKIGSDFKKPYGLTVISEEEAREFLSPLEVRKIPGVGPRTEEMLLDLDIRTIGQLAAADPDRLSRHLGSLGRRLCERAQGIDPNEVVVDYETKSIGREVTFERDIEDAAPVLEMMNGLAEEIHSELVECGFRFKTITVKVRYEHFDTFTRARSLSFSTNDLDILKNNGKRLVDQFLRKRKKVRLVGLRVSALSRV